MLRMVERQNWLWSLDKASALEVDDLADPIFLCKEQWSRILQRGGSIAYGASVDRRWPGFHNQPWFITEQEVVEAWEERRITRDYKKQCCKLISKFGDCLNVTQKTMYGIPDFDTQAKFRQSNEGWASPPSDVPLMPDETPVDGKPGSSTDGA